MKIFITLGLLTLLSLTVSAQRITIQNFDGKTAIPPTLENFLTMANLSPSEFNRQMTQANYVIYWTKDGVTMYDNGASAMVKGCWFCYGKSAYNGAVIYSTDTKPSYAIYTQRLTKQLQAYQTSHGTYNQYVYPRNGRLYVFNIEPRSASNYISCISLTPEEYQRYINQ